MARNYQSHLACTLGLLFQPIVNLLVMSGGYRVSHGEMLYTKASGIYLLMSCRSWVAF
jgi:hypothetical protein